jgi:hypothetical protein
MTRGQCCIWGTTAQLGDPMGEDGTECVSTRAGGRYRITGTAEAMVRSKTPAIKSRVTTMIVDRLRHGDSCPTVTSNDITLATEIAPLPVLSRIDRLLQYFEFKTARISDTILITFTNENSPGDSNGLEALAWTESLKNDEIFYLLNTLIIQGWIEGQGPWRLTPVGYGRIEELGYVHANSSQVFVAMWFSEEMDEVYQNGFHLGITESGYKPLRIDRKEHSNKIDDEIISEIRRSKLLVADFSCELLETAGVKKPIPRGGVYFEAGFAKGLGIPVIWTCRKDLIDYVHFDTRQFNHILWSDADELKKGLINRIGADVGFGPSRKPLQ